MNNTEELKSTAEEISAILLSASVPAQAVEMFIESRKTMALDAALGDTTPAQHFVQLFHEQLSAARAINRNLSESFAQSLQ